MSWNKGLTKETDPRVAQQSNSMKEGYAAGRVVPAKGNSWRKGKNSWNKGLTKETDPRVANHSRVMMGHVGYFAGKTKETCSAIAAVADKRRGQTKENTPSIMIALIKRSETMKKKYPNGPPSNKGKHWKMSAETKEHRARVRSERNLPASNKGGKHTEEWKRGQSERTKAMWGNPATAAKLMHQCKPTKPERRLRDIIEIACPGEYRYVGNGSFTIETLIPDFVNVNGQKKIIECFGDYWHSPRFTTIKPQQTEEGRKKVFAGFGYDCLVIWEHEIYQKSKEDLVSIVKEFNERQLVH